MEHNHSNHLKIKSIGIDTYRENIIYMRHDCHVCLSEGFTALTRVIVKYDGRDIIATLNVIHNTQLLNHSEAALSMEAMRRLNLKEGDLIEVLHLPPVESLRSVRAKLYGQTLPSEAYQQIINDITLGKYSNIELASFIAACSDGRLNNEEIISLTKAMVHSGQKLSWPGIVVDKHCIGGLPGNRTTPIVVSIVAAAGLTIPKTSSRAITSPAGTADTVETFTNVNLDLETIQKVIEKEGGCMAWGGAVNLSPADDILISIERSLDLDSPAQLIASVLRVCFTGSDFMNQYGHNMLSYNQMMGNSQMMGNMSNGTSWQQHMSAEHNPSDEHYGYFDMNAMTFNYTFNFKNTTNGYTRHFLGKR